MSTRKSPLGRNLSSMLSQSTLQKASEPAASDGRLVDLPVEQLRPGQYQPRSVFDPDRLEELAESIRRQGVIQPPFHSS